MNKKSNILVGLDIGTSSITVVIAEAFPDAHLDIRGVGVSPSRGLRKGVVINIEATIEAIAAAVAQAETMAGCRVESVHASISGSHIKGFNSHGIVGIKRREVTQHDVDKVIDAARAVAIPLDREVLHVLPQEFIVDEQDGIHEPLGISGVRLEAKVHIVTGAVASAQNIVKCANRCGLAVDNIVLSPIASARAVLTQEEQELGVCLVDIGGGTIDIAVYHGGAIRHTSVLSLGGNHITNDIAAGLRTPIAAAEEIKCRYGTALARLIGRDDSIEVPSTGGREARGLSRLVLAEIIEPRVNEMLGMIQRELVKAQCEEMLTSGIVLTGGCSDLKGLSQAAEQIFGLPVRIGRPAGPGGLVDLVKGPDFATATGLILYAAREGATQSLSHSSHNFSRVFRKIGDWFGEHF